MIIKRFPKYVNKYPHRNGRQAEIKETQDPNIVIITFGTRPAVHYETTVPFMAIGPTTTLKNYLSDSRCLLAIPGTTRTCFVAFRCIPCAFEPIC